MLRLLLFLLNLTACPPPPAFLRCKLIIPFLIVEGPVSPPTVCLCDARCDYWVLIWGPIKKLWDSSYVFVTTMMKLLCNLVTIARYNEDTLVTVAWVHEEIILGNDCLVVHDCLWLEGLLWTSSHSTSHGLSEGSTRDIIHIFMMNNL